MKITRSKIIIPYKIGNLSIPSIALKIAGISKENLLECHLGDGTIAILKKQMTAKELITSIEFLKDLATDFTVKLALACGECNDCGYCFDDEDDDECPDCCVKCKSPCNGAEIPACLLEDAGINPDDGLEFDTRDGKIIIRSIEQAKPSSISRQNLHSENEFCFANESRDICTSSNANCIKPQAGDISNDVPQGLLEVLAMSDICLTNLHELLESGEIIYG